MVQESCWKCSRLRSSSSPEPLFVSPSAAVIIWHPCTSRPACATDTHLRSSEASRPREKQNGFLRFPPKKQDTKEKQTTIDSPQKCIFKITFLCSFSPRSLETRSLTKQKARRFQIRLLISANVSLRPLNATTGITGEEIQAQWI